ncbi:MAG: hypothetical protein ACLQD9_08155 [Thermoplasmata archaeon]|nr:hypothetical protein [Thermoplasmata archaeon]
MMANQLEGWVFVSFPDEHLPSMLRPGTVRLWDDARTIGKVPGQPVLFLQTEGKAPAWVGSGVVTEVEERWKAFGVYVETRTVLANVLATVAPDVGGHPTKGTVTADSIRSQGVAAWENRALAARLGFGGFRTRTPYLGEERDMRLTASDRSVLCQLQPALKALWPG